MIELTFLGSDFDSQSMNNVPEDPQAHEMTRWMIATSATFAPETVVFDTWLYGLNGAGLDREVDDVIAEIPEITVLDLLSITFEYFGSAETIHVRLWYRDSYGIISTPGYLFVTPEYPLPPSVYYEPGIPYDPHTPAPDPEGPFPFEVCQPPISGVFGICGIAPSGGFLGCGGVPNGSFEPGPEPGDIEPPPLMVPALQHASVAYNPTTGDVTVNWLGIGTTQGVRIYYDYHGDEEVPDLDGDFIDVVDADPGTVNLPDPIIIGEDSVVISVRIEPWSQFPIGGVLGEDTTRTVRYPGIYTMPNWDELQQMLLIEIATRAAADLALQNQVGEVTDVLSGGLEGSVLKKTSDADMDIEWSRRLDHEEFEIDAGVET